MASSQRDDQLSSQIPRMVGQARTRHRVTMNAYGSARRRPWQQVNMNNAAEVSRLDFINRLLHKVAEDLRMKRAPNEKECRALTLSRRCPSTSLSSSSNSNNSNEASRLPQSITARDTGSRKVDKKDNQKKRHRQGSNNFVAITAAAPEREQTNHNRIEVFLCDGLGFRPHLLLNVFRPAYSLGDVTSPNGV
jgi:hypothetical protein